METCDLWVLPGEVNAMHECIVCVSLVWVLFMWLDELPTVWAIQLQYPRLNFTKFIVNVSSHLYALFVTHLLSNVPNNL